MVLIDASFAGVAKWLNVAQKSSTKPTSISLINDCSQLVRLSGFKYQNVHEHSNGLLGTIVSFDDSLVLAAVLVIVYDFFYSNMKKQNSIWKKNNQWYKMIHSSVSMLLFGFGVNRFLRGKLTKFNIKFAEKRILFFIRLGCSFILKRDRCLATITIWKWLFDWLYRLHTEWLIF